MCFSFHRGLVYGVYGCAWSQMIVGDLMSHALVYIEIGNIVEFSLRSCLFGKWNTYKVSVIQIAKIQF
jgi:hypothetical protein